jgi:hypothetical protein
VEASARHHRKTLGRHRRLRQCASSICAPASTRTYPDRLQQRQRDGIELTGSFTASTPHEGRRDRETITVSSETPIVDTQSVRRR